jgi:hypothetical protein
MVVPNAIGGFVHGLAGGLNAGKIYGRCCKRKGAIDCLIIEPEKTRRKLVDLSSV